MGKVKTRFLGLEEIEKKQKQEQKKKSQEKQTKRIKAPGKHKGGEKMKVVEASDEALAKMKKAEEMIKEKPAFAEATAGKAKEKRAIKERKRGKKYQLSLRTKSSQTKKSFSVKEAVDLLKKMAFANFDESIELHINTLKTGLRGEVELPHKSGKTFRVKIVSDTVIADIEKGNIDFDVLISHPSYMPKIAPLAKILGPKGLMPNPKTGTISDKPEEVAKKFSAGLIRWKTEAKFPIIHQLVGKISYDDKKLVENINAFITKVGKNNIKSVYLSSTMSPALPLTI